MNGLLLGKFMPYIAGGMLLALGVAVLAWRVEAGRLADRTMQRDAARAQVVQLTAAAEGKDETITALKAASDSWKRLATPAATLDTAAARVEAAAQKIEARSRAMTPAEVKDHDDPTCAAALALDLARACPGIAAGLRQRAAPGGLPRPPN